MRLWVVGMAGAGKTEAGRAAARSLSVDFTDTDELIEMRAGVPIPELWRSRGEGAFRCLERAAVVQAARVDGVVATGGGAVLDPSSRALMRSDPVVWLRASPETVAGRLAEAGERPLITEECRPAAAVVAELMERRDPLYREVADHEIHTDGLTTAEVAARIEAVWND